MMYERVYERMYERVYENCLKMSAVQLYRFPKNISDHFNKVKKY